MVLVIFAFIVSRSLGVASEKALSSGKLYFG